MRWRLLSTAVFALSYVGGLFLLQRFFRIDDLAYMLVWMLAVVTWPIVEFLDDEGKRRRAVGR